MFSLEAEAATRDQERPSEATRWSPIAVLKQREVYKPYMVISDD